MIENAEGDFVFQHDKKIGSTVIQKHTNESEVYQWFYRNKEKVDGIQKTASSDRRSRSRRRLSCET